MVPDDPSPSDPPPNSPAHRQSSRAGRGANMHVLIGMERGDRNHRERIRNQLRAEAMLPIERRASASGRQRRLRESLTPEERQAARNQNSTGRRRRRDRQSVTEQQAESESNIQARRETRQQIHQEAAEELEAALAELNAGRIAGNPTQAVLDLFEHHPQAAQLFFAESTGFGAHNDAFKGRDADVSELTRLGPLSRSDLTGCVKNFQKSMSPSLPKSSCASCGTMKLGQVFTSFELRSLNILRLLPDTPRHSTYTRVSEDAKNFFTVFTDHDGDTSVLYNVHPDLVSSDLQVRLCLDCCRAVTAKHSYVPHFNVGNGFDFGRVPVNWILTDAEVVAVSRCLKFQTMLKFVKSEQKAVTGHAIVLEHEGNKVLATKLPSVPTIVKCLSVVFVGSKAMWNNLTESPESRSRFVEANRSILSVCPQKVLRWLRVKKELDPTSDFEIDESEEVMQGLKDLPDNLLSTAEFVDDAEAIRVQNVSGDSVATIPHSATDEQDPPESNTAVMNSVSVQQAILGSDITTAALLGAFRKVIANSGDESSQDGDEENETEGQPDEGQMSDEDESLDSDSSACSEDQPPNDSGAGTSPADLIGQVEPPHERHGPVPIEVSREAVRDFVNNNLVMYGAFGHLFVLGQGLTGSGLLPQRLLTHVLSQHSRKFAESHHFIFFLFNQLQRMAASAQARLRVLGSTATTKRFSELVNDPTFLTKLNRCINTPDSQEARDLVKLITELMSVTGSKIPWSQMERESAFPRLLALRRHFGPYSFFMTVSPADMDNPLTLRLSQEATGYDTEVVPCDLPGIRERMMIISKNPVAAAQVYKQLIDAVLSDLLGMDPSHLSKVSPKPVSLRRDGILGVTIAYAGVHEMQTRGTPHFHCLIITDISSLCFQKYLDSEEFRKLFAARLDSALRAYLPDNADAIGETFSALPRKEQTPMFRDHRIQPNADNWEEVETMGTAVACSCNKHVHTFTCHKGPQGRRKCRFGLPRGCHCQPTTFVQIEWGTDPKTGKSVPVALREIRHKEDYSGGDPILKRLDKRDIVTELHRPGVDCHCESGENDSGEVPVEPSPECPYRKDCAQGPNGNVVSYSIPLSACTRCNTDVGYLGNLSQEKGATFYILKYMTKDGETLSAVLPLLREVYNKAQQYPSTAEDAGTAKRNSMFILTKFINRHTASAEISAQQAALGLLGCPSNMYSHEFSYVFVRPAIAAVRRTLESRGVETPDEDTASESGVSDDSDEITLEDLVSTEASEVHIDGGDGTTTSNASESFDQDENRNVVKDKTGNWTTIAQFVHYMYRGPQLARLTYYQYCCLISINKKAPGPQVEGARRRNATFEFDARHPQSNTHCQMLRSKQRIPILAGPPPPLHPGVANESKSWRLKANRWAEYVIVLHSPWDLDTFVPKQELTYEGLSNWFAELEDSPYLDDRVTAFWIENLANGLRLESGRLKLMSQWRARFARNWNAADHILHNTGNGTVEERGISLGLADELIQAEYKIMQALGPDTLPPDSVLLAERTAETLEQLASTICKSTMMDKLTYADVHKNSDIQSKYDSLSRNVSDHDEAAAEQVLTNGQDNEVEDGENGLDVADEQYQSGAPVSDARLDETLADIATQFRPVEIGPVENLENAQNKILQDVCEWYNEAFAGPRGRRPEKTLHTLLTGAAGTGKSYVVRKIVERLGKDKVRCVAFQGIAASQLPDGQTIHSAFNIDIRPRKSTSGPSRKEIAAKQQFLNTALLIIDEVSTMTSDLLAIVDTKLRLWLSRPEPFGGLGVILMGDMFQLPPVGGMSLLRAMNIGNNAGGSLFRLFKTVTLDVQRRRKDMTVAQQDALNLFRDPVKSATPIKDSKLLSTIKVLSKDDYKRDPTWSEATTIVSENITRMAINKRQAFIFARKHNLPVISWRQKIVEKSQSYFKQASSGSSEELTRILDKHSELTFYFVAGAPAVMKDNLSTANGLANGRTCKLYSITLEDQDRYLWEEIDRTLPGREFRLPRIPFSVNVELDHSTDFLRRLTLVEGRTIIPMRPMDRFPRQLPLPGLPRKLRSGTEHKGVQYIDHGLDLAFAVTYHKVQGRTLDKVIVDINVPSSVSVAGFYVAVSRVTNSDNMRYLPIFNKETVVDALESREFEGNLIKWFLAQQPTHSELAAAPTKIAKSTGLHKKGGEKRAASPTEQEQGSGPRRTPKRPKSSA